jgi:hypothetical protein
LGNPRTEIVSIDADRLAEHAFDQMMTGRFRYTGEGLVCVQAVPVEEFSTLLTVSTVADGGWRTKADAPDHFLFRSDRDRKAVFNEIETLRAMFWTATRVDGIIKLNVPVDRVDEVIRECLQWCGSKSSVEGDRLVSSAEIKASIADVKREIQRSLVQLQQTGWLKALNGGYKALRATPRAEGERIIPSYRDWATEQLEGQILQKLAVFASPI